MHEVAMPVLPKSGSVPSTHQSAIDLYDLRSTHARLKCDLSGLLQPVQVRWNRLTDGSCNCCV